MGNSCSVKPTEDKAMSTRRSRPKASNSGICTVKPSAMISETFMRGDKDAKGSWNTTCTMRRKGKSTLDLPVQECPETFIWPWMGTKPKAANARLVLPEPDSPITPKVWPWRRTKLTSCKAVNFLGMNQAFTPPPETGYFTPKLQPCIMTGASAGGTTTSRIGWLLSNFWV